MYYHSYRRTMRALSFISSLLLSTVVGAYALIGLGLMVCALLSGLFLAIKSLSQDPLSSGFALALSALAMFCLRLAWNEFRDQFLQGVEPLDEGYLLDEEEEPAIYALVKSTAERIRAPMPDSIWVTPQSWSYRRFGISGTPGMTTLRIGMDTFNSTTVTQIEGLVAHELQHSRQVWSHRIDVISMFTASLMIGLLSALSFGAFSQLGEDDSDKPVHPLRNLAALTTVYITCPLALLLFLQTLSIQWLRRENEFDADYTEATLTGPTQFAQTMAIIEGDDSLLSDTRFGIMRRAWQALSPAKWSLLDTHPSAHTRIRAVQGVPEPQPDARPATSLWKDQSTMHAHVYGETTVDTDSRLDEAQELSRWPLL